MNTWLSSGPPVSIIPETANRLPSTVTVPPLPIPSLDASEVPSTTPDGESGHAPSMYHHGETVLIPAANSLASPGRGSPFSYQAPTISTGSSLPPAERVPPVSKKGD